MAEQGISLNLSCPNCGGTVTSVEGQRTIACPYCQSLSFVEGDRGTYTVMFQNAQAEATVRTNVQQWFDKGLKARDLPQQATITEIYPIYIPFWRLRARAAGWVCGYREERHTDSQGNTHTRRVPMEKMVFRDFEWSEIACDPGDIGIKRLPGLHGNVIAHEEGSIPTFEATTSPDDARSKGVETIRGMAISSASVPHITYQKMHVSPKYLGLTFYPVWICRYLYRGRSYFATFDGVNGKSLSGRAPGDPLYQSLALVAGAALGGAITGASATIGLAEVGEIGIAGIIIGAVIFVVGFYFFRHGSEVTEGDIEKPYQSYKKPLKGLMKNVQNGRL
jgi:DNA-directed RNA polymerase subunit RPC12/RpoP